jgi:hypothetical protein
MATKKSKSSPKLYTYQNGKKLFLRKKPDQYVVRIPPDLLIETDKMKAIERVSPSSTRVTVNSNVLDSEMKKIRKEAVTHHAYALEDSDAEFLITDRIIVTFKNPATHAALTAFMTKYALILLKKYSDTEFLFQLTEQTGMNPVKLVVQITETESTVALCEHDLNRRVKRSRLNLPIDAKYNQQWHLHKRLVNTEFDQRSSSNCEEAWTLLGHFGNSDVVIGVTDDGCKIDHPDFDSPGKFASWGYMSGLTLVHRDAISANPQQMYQTGADHGTACNGITGAEVDASLVVGAAPGCRLLPIKWESDDQGLYISDDKFLTVLNFIGDKVDALSNSWGLSPAEIWATNVVNKIKSLAATGGRRGKGIVFLFAAGNENCPIDFSSNLDIPYTSGVEVRPDGSGVWVGVETSKTFSHNLVGIPGVIHIAALASNAQRSHYSNYGTGISLCAPTNNVHKYHRLSVPRLALKQRAAAPPPSDIPSGAAIVAPQAETPAPLQELPGQRAVAAHAPQSSPLPIASEDYAGLEESSSDSYTEAPETARRGEADLVPYDPGAAGQLGGGAAPKAFAPPRLQAMRNVSGYLEGNHKTSAYMAGAPQQAPQRGGAEASQADLARALRAFQGAQEQAQGGAQRSRAQRRSRSSTQGAGLIAFGAGPGMGTRATAAESSLTGEAPQGQPGRRSVLGVSKGAPAGNAAIEAAVRRFAAPNGRSVVAYFAPWCGFCHQGAGQVRQMRERLAAQGVHMVIVVGQDSTDKLQALASKIGGPVMIDESGSNPLRSVPGYVLVQDGRPAAIQRGLFRSLDDAVAWGSR